MSSVSEDAWEPIGQSLKNVDYPKKYVTPERYDVQNPLEVLVALPDYDDFFGTKVLNLYIVGQPLGYAPAAQTESWPPAGYEDALQRHKDTYNQFAKYKTRVWMDFAIVKKVMAADPDSNFRDQMLTTEGRVEQMCLDLAEYGFEYMGKIEDYPESNFFKQYVDDFYSEN